MSFVTDCPGWLLVLPPQAAPGDLAVVSVWIDSGSRYESAALSGASNLISRVALKVIGRMFAFVRSTWSLCASLVAIDNHRPLLLGLRHNPLDAALGHVLARVGTAVGSCALRGHARIRLAACDHTTLVKTGFKPSFRVAGQKDTMMMMMTPPVLTLSCCRAGVRG
jgi:hypothetical protein